jgi:hypothetical protein
MSFAEAYKRRFTEIIRPAVESLAPEGQRLDAYRVDVSKTGDSILTDIVDGIAHSRLILADISVVGKDSVTGAPYRNSNVLYEVGIALACRQPEEVLPIHDDRDKFLFDVSTVPHRHVAFADPEQAKRDITEALQDRLEAQQFTRDARVAMAMAGLTENEVKILLELIEQPPGTVGSWSPGGTVLSVYEYAIGRLIDKGGIEMADRHQVSGVPRYRLTPLGRVVAERARESRRLA